VFVRIPTVDGRGDCLRIILEGIKDTSHWQKLAAEAMLDGTMTEDELSKIIAKGDEATVHNEQLKLILAARQRRVA
jgi:hypothetical protein